MPGTRGRGAPDLGLNGAETDGKPMDLSDTTLTITTEQDPSAAAPMLRMQCAHGTTTLTLPVAVDGAAERVATTLAVLQHYRTTGCSCTRTAQH